MISVIIPVRNKSLSRLRRTIDSIKDSEIIGEIIIVDYGSDTPIKFPGKKVKVIRYNKNLFFNKSHAINLGIKESKQDYIATLDADIIPSPEFIKAVGLYLNPKSFIYTRKVRRIQCKWFKSKLPWKELIKHSEHWKQWRGVRWTDELSHRGTGGIQIYPKKWIIKVRGADEALVGMGGMDGEMLYRAYNTGLHIIQINELTLHQEHPSMKESQFPQEQRKFLTYLRGLKPKYLIKKAQYKKNTTNPGFWGHAGKANQKQLIDETIEIAKKVNDGLLLRDIKIIKLFQALKKKSLTRAQFKKRMEQITNKKIKDTKKDPEEILKGFIEDQYLTPKEEFNRKMKEVAKELRSMINNKNMNNKELSKKLSILATDQELNIFYPKKNETKDTTSNNK